MGQGCSHLALSQSTSTRLGIADIVLILSLFGAAAAAGEKGAGDLALRLKYENGATGKNLVWDLVYAALGEER